MKYYAVKRGHVTGIFEEWSACQAATKGFSKSEFRSFNTKEEAEAYLEDRDVWAEQVKKDNEAGYLVAFTDGSYEDKLKRYSYGVFLISPDGSTSSLCGYDNNPKYIESKNIIGEIFGVINALDWAISNGCEKIKIYHEYEGLSKWALGEWSANTESSKRYVELFQNKFDGFLDIEFVKVPGHSNVSFNEKADQLAKLALIDIKKETVQGSGWFSIPYFKQQDFEAFAKIITDSDGDITCESSDRHEKIIYLFRLNRDTVTVTLFKTGQHTLLVQGKPSYLFQVIAATIIELEDGSAVEQIMGDAYRISIEKDKVNAAYEPIVRGLPADYPDGIKRLVKQSIINLDYYVEAEDYSQYAFSALKALEGHIKYLITKAGHSVSRQFNHFDKDSCTGEYIFKYSCSDVELKKSIEESYNYFVSKRHTLFHFGDIIGATDNTRFINTKEEANEIIEGCLEKIQLHV